MVKRPLLWVAGILFIGFFLFQTFFGDRASERFYVLDSQFEDSVQASLTGKFDHRDVKANSTYYFLKDVTVSLNGESNSYHFSDFLVIESKKTSKDSADSQDGNGEAQDGQTQEEKQIESGNILLVSGTVYSFETPTNPGQFDEKSYYRQQNIYYKMFASDITVTQSKVNRYKQALFHLRDKILAVYEACMSEKNAGVVSAMLLGDKSLLDADVKSLYQANGIGHILAISGLHISILCTFLSKILSALNVPKRICFCLTVFFLVSYDVMTGSGISTNRAVIMTIFLLTAEQIGRSYDALTALAFSAICVLLQKPYAVTSGSFLLSYSAMLGCLYTTKALNTFVFGDKQKQRENMRKQHRKEKEWYANSRLIQFVFRLFTEKSGGKKVPKKVEHWGKNYCKFVCGLPQKLLSAVLFSVAISLTTFPVILYLYYEVPTYSVLLNLIVLPLASVVVVTAFAGGIIGLFCLPLANIVLKPAGLVLSLYEWLCRQILKLPKPILVLGAPERRGIIFFVLLFFLLVFYWNQRYYKRRKEKDENPLPTDHPAVKTGQRLCHGFSVLACFFAFLALCYHKPLDGLAVTMLDVGQGDGILLRTRENRTILIDGGSTSVSNVGTYRILPCLKYYGISTIDYMIMTHPDADHVSGQLEILEAGKESGVTVANYLLPHPSEESFGQEDDVLVEAAKEAGANVYYLKSGSSLHLGSLELLCLHPQEGFVADSANAASTVLSLTYDNFTMLLTGDMEKNGEENVIEALNNEDLPRQYDVLKVAHHGSKYTNSEEFLSLVNPRYSIISAGKNNSYGHPHKETLDRLSACGSEVYTTIEGGAIEVITDGEKFSVQYYESRHSF